MKATLRANLPEGEIDLILSPDPILPKPSPQEIERREEQIALLTALSRLRPTINWQETADEQLVFRFEEPEPEEDEAAS